MASLWRALAIVWLGGVGSPALMDDIEPVNVVVEGPADPASVSESAAPSSDEQGGVGLRRVMILDHSPMPREQRWRSSRELTALLILTCLAGCSGSASREAPPDTAAQTDGEKLCKDSAWKEQHLGLWFDACRRAAL